MKDFRGARYAILADVRDPAREVSHLPILALRLGRRKKHRERREYTHRRSDAMPALQCMALLSHLFGGTMAIRAAVRGESVPTSCRFLPSRWFTLESKVDHDGDSNDSVSGRFLAGNAAAAGPRH